MQLWAPAFVGKQTLAIAGLLLLAGCGGGIHRVVGDTPVKIGRPYTVGGRTYYPADDPAYDRIGEASWYGRAEQGRRTASGEIFYRERPSAAHTTLPLPSYVEVTRLDTGVRILVRVNDRGPYARDRILDLSQEAARELGIDRAGRAMVRVRRVTPRAKDRDRLRRGYPVELSSVAPTVTPPRTGHIAPYLAPSLQQPVTVAPAPVAPPPTYRASAAASLAGPSILVAAPADPDAADALATALASEGARVIPTAQGYRVVTGPYLDDAGVSAALARLRARGYQGVTVIDAASPQEPNGTVQP